MSVVRLQPYFSCYSGGLLCLSERRHAGAETNWTQMKNTSNDFLCVLKPGLSLDHCFEVFLDSQLDG